MNETRFSRVKLSNLYCDLLQPNVYLFFSLFCALECNRISNNETKYLSITVNKSKSINKELMRIVQNEKW